MDALKINYPKLKNYRWYAIKLLEMDREITKSYPVHLPDVIDRSYESDIINEKYDFIQEIIREVLVNKDRQDALTEKADKVLTHRVWGVPIFLGIMAVVFLLTFTVGDWLKGYLEIGIENLSLWIEKGLVAAQVNEVIRSLIVDGILAGVGGILTFLPNIFILFLALAFLEDSGYMARVAYVMEGIMSKLGLSGRAFIPMILGFGCTVPAIMASRALESRRDRFKVMLITPFMSCSARLPVYVLLTGAFFPKNASFVLLALYVSGILLAVIMARLFKRFLFNEEDVPFVMELPPYRMPTGKSIMIHMWEKAKQYLHKMGGIILVASIIIWFLGYFPRHSESGDQFDRQIAEIENTELDSQEKTDTIEELERLKAIDHQQNSYIGRIGQTIQPILAPLGFDWKMSVSLLTGMAAKEVVVSTLSVLYTGNADDDSQALSERLKQDRNAEGNLVFTPLIAISLMLFVLIYFPCIATISAIVNESGSWKWGIFVIIYTCVLAWIVSFIVYQTGNFFVGLFC